MKRSRIAIALCVLAVALVTGQVIGATTLPDIPPGVTELITEAEGQQKVILQDGVVTMEELEGAIRAAVSCMEKAGLQVSLDLNLSDNAWAIRFDGGPTMESLRQAQQQVDDCEAEHLQLVSSVYAFAAQPTDEEFLSEYAEIAACLRRNGVDVRDDTVEAVVEATTTDTEAYIKCSKNL